MAAKDEKIEQASEYVTFQTKQIEELSSEIVKLKSVVDDDLKKKTQGACVCSCVCTRVCVCVCMCEYLCLCQRLIDRDEECVYV